MMTNQSMTRQIFTPITLLNLNSNQDKSYHSSKDEEEEKKKTKKTKKEKKEKIGKKGMTFFTKELRDKLEEKRRNAMDLDTKLELEEKERKQAEQAKLVEHQVRRQDKLLGGRTRALARVHVVEL